MQTPSSMWAAPLGRSGVNGEHKCEECPRRLFGVCLKGEAHTRVRFYTRVKMQAEVRGNGHTRWAHATCALPSTREERYDGA